MEDAEPIWSYEQIAFSQPISSMVLSSDGATVAFVQKRDSSSFLVLKDADGYGAENVCALANSPKTLLSWNATNDAIWYISDQHELCYWRLFGTECNVVRKFAGVTAATSDSNAFRFAVVEDYARLFVVDVDGNFVEVIDPGEFVNSPALSPKGDEVAWVTWQPPYMEWQRSKIMRAKLDPDQLKVNEKSVAIEHARSQCQVPKYSPNGKTLSFLTDKSGWLNIALVDRASLQHELVLVPERVEQGVTVWANDRQYCWSSDSESIYFSRSVSGSGELVRADIGSGTVEAIASGVFSEVLESERVLIALGASASASDAVLNLTSKEPLCYSAPQQITSSLSLPESVEFESDSHKIPARLYRAIDGHGGLVISLHGGPHGISPATPNWRWTYFLTRGWSVLNVDYRGSTSWGRGFSDALNGQYGVADVEDVLLAAEEAVRRRWCDPEKIVLLGGSSAGLTVLNTLADSEFNFYAGLVDYPVADLLELAESTWRYEKHYFDSLIGPLPEFHDEYLARSPINKVSQITSPVLVCQGEADVVVPKECTDRFVAAMVRAKKDIEYYVIEGEGHGFKNASTKVKVMELYDAFLKQIPLNDVDEDEQ